MKIYEFIINTGRTEQTQHSFASSGESNTAPIPTANISVRPVCNTNSLL